MTLLDDHPEGEGLLINPQSILKMRVEKAVLLWSNLIFDLKTHTNQLFGVWCLKVMGLPG